MDMEVFLQKDTEILGAHKIGAAISGPRIADKKICGHEDLSDLRQEIASEDSYRGGGGSLNNWGRVHTRCANQFCFKSRENLPGHLRPVIIRFYVILN